MNKYSQRQFALLVGVSRRWLQIQAEQGKLVPTTDENGKNFYTDEHIAIVEKLRAESPRMKKNETAETEITSETPSLPAGETIAPSDVQTPAVSENDATDGDSDISDKEPVEEISAADDAPQPNTTDTEIFDAPIVSEDDSKEIVPAAHEEISPTQSETVTLEIPFEIVTLDQRAARIRKLSADVQRGIIEIGNELIAAKAEIGHGNWSEWLKNELGWAQRTATRFMAVARRFGKLANVGQFKSATLQAMLALPEGEEQEFIDEQAEKDKPVSEMSARQVQAAVKEFNRQREAELNTLANGVDSNAEYGGAQNFDNATGQIPPETFSPDEVKDESSPAVNNPIGNSPAAPPTSDEQGETGTPNKKKLPVQQNHNQKDAEYSDEYYTPEKYIEAARRVFGGSIDLDPASCEKANETVKATKIYTKENSGFNEYWEGNVWMNPPYSKGVIDKFVDKLTSSGGVTSWIVLVPARTDRKWFEELAAFSDAIVFTNHRVKCLRNGVDDTSGPTSGSAFFYRGNDTKKFCEEFSQFGWCAKYVNPINV